MTRLDAYEVARATGGKVFQAENKAGADEFFVGRSPRDGFRWAARCGFKRCIPVPEHLYRTTEGE